MQKNCFRKFANNSCIELLKNMDKLETMSKNCIKWWNKKTNNIHNLIIENIKFYYYIFIMSSCLICGCVKNYKKYIDDVFNNILKIQELFKNSRII